MRRRHLLRILTASAGAVATPFAAAETAGPGTNASPPDDEISRVCDLIARYLDREYASDSAYEALIAILRRECRPFEVPEWLAEDEFWQYSQRIEQKYQKRRSGIAGL